jgi:SpoVK/Ycf46/Vps4 family AAA+-type ATPase
VFRDLVDLFNEKKGASDEIFIHRFGSDKTWEEVGKIPMRDVDTFCMNEDQKRDILKKITDFTNRREWYRKKGLTYKTSFLFYGPPGTGKTTLAKLLASHFRKDVYLIDLSQHSNNSLIEALSSIKPGSIVLMEDVDQAGGAVKDRKKKKELTEAISDSLSPLTMSGMLNAFDGVVGLDNVIVIMTTNHPEDLDEAVRRKSRIDNDYLIGELTNKEIAPYMKLMYELDDLETQRFMLSVHSEEWELPGCEVENAFKENPDDPEAFVRELARRNHVKRLKLAA